MQYEVAAYSDVGMKKKTNQDSVLIRVADTIQGEAILAVLCDGMGGLAKGELASATLVKAFSDWFSEVFPGIIRSGYSVEKVSDSWKKLIDRINCLIWDYSEKNNLRMGTTAVVLLLFQDKYLVMNVGDSRAYLLTNTIAQITKDQTYVQREIDMGRMTLEEAERHSHRNVLLQCVGASEMVHPDVYQGKIVRNSVFLLCSDGFRHKVSAQEIYEKMKPEAMVTYEQMMKNAEYLTDENKRRSEEDNISVAMVKIY